MLSGSWSGSGSARLVLGHHCFDPEYKLKQRTSHVVAVSWVKNSTTPIKLIDKLKDYMGEANIIISQPVQL